MNNYVITVARGFGTGGKQIASQLAAELGIECYENRILTLASEYSGYDEKVFLEVNEKLREGYFLRKLKGIPHTIAPKPVTNQFASDDNLFEYQAEIIQHLAKTESCVIVGKCADYVLKDFDNVISIYIEAPRAYCVNRIMKSMQVGEEEANNLISKTDQYRADYYKYYTKGNYWTNPVNYDLTINSEKVGSDRAVSLIKHYLNLKMNLSNPV